jgi:hypothetical protein
MTEAKNNHAKKQQRKGRSPAGEKAKKVVSLTIDPKTLAFIDEFAAKRNISRSQAVEYAIDTMPMCEKCPLEEADTPIASTKSAETENSLVKPNNCLYASPQVGKAIFY